MWRNEQGVALLAVLLVLALLAVIGTATLTLAHHSKIAATTGDATQALFVAESGIERALAKLKTNPLWPDGTNEYPKEIDGDEVEGSCGEGTIAEVKINRTSVTAAGVDVTITSTGRCGNAVRTVRAEVTVSHDWFICGKGVTAVILCGDTLCFNGLAEVDGAVATRLIDVGGTEKMGHGCRNNCKCRIDGSVHLRYDQSLFSLYPPGMPYTVTVHSRQEV